MGSVVVVYRLSCPTACGILDPRPGIKPASPELEGRFFTTGPPGRSLFYFSFSGYCKLASLTHKNLTLINAHTLSLDNVKPLRHIEFFSSFPTYMSELACILILCIFKIQPNISVIYLYRCIHLFAYFLLMLFVRHCIC